MRNGSDTEYKTHSASSRKDGQNAKSQRRTKTYSVRSESRDSPHRLARRREAKVVYTDGLFSGTPPASIATTSKGKTETHNKISSPCSVPSLVKTGTQLARSGDEPENSQRKLKFAQVNSGYAERETKRSWTQKIEAFGQPQKSKEDGRFITDETITCSPTVGDKGSVHRYALFRSMLRSSQIAKTAKTAPPRGDVSRPTNESLVSLHFDEEGSTSREEDIQSRLRSSRGQVHVESEPPPAEDLTNCDLRGTEFPKRIYIREVVNDAIVDELVDVRGRRDWEILTYMSPLRPLRPEKLYSKTSRDISFPDLKDFQIYYFAFPWK